MNMAIVSLVLLVTVIAVGFWKKVNVGIISIFIAFILGTCLGIKDADVIKGFGTQLFIMLLGITLLCSIAQANGSIDLFAKKCTALTGNRTWLAPIMIWLIGAVISGAGPGSIPSLGIVCAIAVPFGIATGYSPLMMCALGEIGIFFGRFTPITTDCSVIMSVAAPQGYTDYSMTLMTSALLVSIVEAIFVFIVFKGYKVRNAGNLSKETLPAFNRNQIFTLLGFAILVLVVLIFRKNVGLVGFTVSAILILIGAVDEKQAIKGVPWGTLLMITGVGVLMKLVINCGGIELLSSMLSTIMTPATAATITGFTAGVMSWFSSATGVVYPTMIPTVGSIVQHMDNAVEPNILISMIAMSAAYAGLSPASTGGGLILAASATDPNFTKGDEDKMFVRLFILSVATIIIIGIMALMGIFNLFL